jgi:hypothetical protein
MSYASSSRGGRTAVRRKVGIHSPKNSTRAARAAAGRKGGRAGDPEKKRAAGYLKHQHGIGFHSDIRYAQAGGRTAGRKVATKLIECEQCGTTVSQLWANRWCSGRGECPMTKTRVRKQKERWLVEQARRLKEKREKTQRKGTKLFGSGISLPAKPAVEVFTTGERAHGERHGREDTANQET